MTLNDIMADLEAHGDNNIKKILLKHGVKEPFFGVKVEHLKIIEKKIKKDYTLANQLFFTKNADAMYLAGLIADDKQMTKEDLRAWAVLAVSNNISGYTVPWVAAGSRYGFELAMEWIEAHEEHVAAVGWATLSGLVALKPDNELNLPTLKTLLTRIEQNIHTSPNLVRQTMNGFIIAVGSYVVDLTSLAIATANSIGTVSVDNNGTACKVPDAIVYIQKVSDKQQLGKKKKKLKC